LRYVATSFGSAGDFLPTLAIAHELREAGHEVVFVTNPFHETEVRALGLEFVAAGAHLDLYGMLKRDPTLLSTTRGLGVIVEHGAPFFAATYRVAREIMRGSRVDAVVGSNLSNGLFWAAAERRVPAVMVTATPVTWMSARAPIQFLDFAVPEWLLPSLIGVTRTAAVFLADHWLRSVARTIGPTSFDASLSAIEAGLALHVGTWPSLLRPASEADAPNARACGFARVGHLGTSAPALSAELEAFLSAGPPPVVVGLGSIFSLGSDDVVADAAAACADLGKRCVIVGPAPRSRDLPEGTLVVPYATYHLLFPRADAVIIHGGAGTTGEALKSGRPTVVVPFAFDQFGLAWQVERLGTGVRVPKRARSRETLRQALEAVDDSALRARAAEVAAELAPAPDGARVAAGLIEALGRR
jgi:UDP-N-acetylglucosamine:LPS N-acetylglucosamine transferase